MNMNEAQEIQVYRHGLHPHSVYKTAIICKEADGWAIVWPDGWTQFHIPSLLVARAEISADSRTAQL